jgi:general secretion pathway protein G
MWSKPMWSKPMNTMRHRNFRSAQGGFSLIEILIVVALIALIAGMVANQVFGGADKARVKLAVSGVADLAGKIEQYEMDTGGLPQSLNDLVSESGNVKGWLGPYTRESALKDPWNNPYDYRVPGEDAPFAVISYGSDRKAGGSGVDADISSND